MTRLIVVPLHAVQEIAKGWNLFVDNLTARRYAEGLADGVALVLAAQAKRLAPSTDKEQQ